MSVTVRRLGLVAVAMATGASALSTSMSSADATTLHRSTLDLAVSGPNTGTSRPAAWAIRNAVSGSTPAEDLPDYPAHPDGIIVVALRVRLAGAAPEVVVTDAPTVADLFRALGETVWRSDRVRPGMDSPLWQGATVTLVTVRRAVREVAEPTPFSTLIQYSKEMDSGVSRVLKAGVEGRVDRRYRITYRNGREVTRELLSEKMLSLPVAQVLLEGTRPVAAGHGTVEGQASWYARSGMCAAHLTLPKGTMVRVTNLDNGASVTVIIDDRGPYGIPGRIIDLCQTAFAQIAPLGQGVASVSLTW